MTTGTWLRISSQRYVLTALLGWAIAVAILPRADDPFGEVFVAGMGLGLIGVPLLTIATMFVITLLADRRFEPPDGGIQRIRGGWTVALPLLLALPVGLLMPLSYLVMVGTQLVFVFWVLPRQDAHDTADVLVSLSDPAVPTEQRVRIARAVAGLRSRPVMEALVDAATDEQREVAEAALETLCTIWQRDRVIAEDLLLKLPPNDQDRIRALEVRIRSPW